MPSGVVTLGQAAARFSLLTVACNRCERAGKLRTNRLSAEHGLIAIFMITAGNVSRIRPTV